MSRSYNLTVGPVPNRRGIWLGRSEGTEWHPLAKFRNENAAQEFLDAMKAAKVGNGESE